MYILRTRFKKEIVCEFLPPARKSNRVIILTSGIPSVPAKKEVMEFLSKKGYWVFFPRYRGTWESDGRFLKISPHKDIIDIIDQLPKGFPNLWNNERFKIQSGKIYIIGSSFGGAAALLASRDARIAKVFLFSPVIDWQALSKVEPLDWLYDFMKTAFGNGYRLNRASWNKLKSGRFYNPIRHTNEIDGRKVFIIHAKDDKITPWRPARKFARLTGSKIIFLNKGGHMGGSNILRPVYWKRFQKFIKI